MINPNELRIGNFVSALYDEEFIQIEINGILAGGKGRNEVGFRGADGWSKFCYFKNLEGISLTEEWLLKFGFKKNKQMHPEFPNLFEWVLTYKENGMPRYFSIQFGGKEAALLSGGLLAYKHVHDLQNIVFALTRKELELKKETA